MLFRLCLILACRMFKADNRMTDQYGGNVVIHQLTGEFLFTQLRKNATMPQPISASGLHCARLRAYITVFESAMYIHLKMRSNLQFRYEFE